MLVTEMRAKRPDIMIVGMSIQNREDDFSAMKVTRFLNKPVDSVAVLEMLRATQSAIA